MGKYSDQELLNQIRSLADGERRLTAREFQDCPETAAATTVREQFGSWNKAVRAAGCTPNDNQYSDQELLSQIRRLADGERRLTAQEFQDCPETAAVTTVREQFGSWNKAVRAAGCTPNDKQYSDQELLNQIRRLADGERPPTGSEFQDCPETAAVSTVREQFGSWNKAVRVAGCTPNDKQYSDQELLNQIRSLADEERRLTAQEFQDCPETAAAATVCRQFGSWKEAVRAAGCTSGDKQYSNQELLNQIRSLAEEDTPPTKQKFRDCPETAAAGTIKDRFGSWNEGVRAAGCTPRDKQYSERELIRALEQAASSGEIKKIKDDTVDSCDYPCRRVYRRRFGGYAVAALRGSINIGCSGRQKAVPLSKMELYQLVDQIPQIDPCDQAVVIVSLLTGCHKNEHKWVGKEGIEDTETDPVLLFPSEAKRGNRSVSVGALYNQFVREFDPICSERLRQSIEFSRYPLGDLDAYFALRRTSEAVDLDIDRPVADHSESQSGPQVLHMDLRCTHYLFEYCRGASQAMLKRRLALSDDEIEHYHRFLDDPKGDSGWSVKIEWRD